MMRKIVITKSPDGDSEIADAVRSAGFEPVIEPSLEIEYLKGDAPDISGERTLIFTSAHGVNAYAEIYPARTNKVFTVGHETADAARAIGFINIADAGGTAEDLVGLIASAPEIDLISPIYVRGEDISRDLRSILAKKDIYIAELIAYRASIVESLSINLLKSLDNREIYAVMLFSSRGARAFAGLIEQYGRTVRVKHTKALCISQSVLESVSVLPFEQTLIATSPDRAGMLDLLKQVSVR